MGKILAFPSSARHCGGVVHAYPFNDGFEIAHESSSGNSWGSFEQFDCPQAAVAGAYRLNRDTYGNSCTVDLHPGLLAALPDDNAVNPGDF